MVGSPYSPRDSQETLVGHLLWKGMISTGDLLARCTVVPLPSVSLLNPALVPILLFSSPHSSSKINPREARRKETFHKRKEQPTTWISSARYTWDPFTFHTTNSIFRNTPHPPRTEIHLRQHPFTVMGGFPHPWELKLFTAIWRHH